MLRMVRAVNTDWSAHVGQAGVTCYTGHRGQPVTPDAWHPSPAQHPAEQIASQEHWSEQARSVRDFFPDAGFAQYLVQNTPGLVQARTAMTPPHGGAATASGGGAAAEQGAGAATAPSEGVASAFDAGAMAAIGVASPIEVKRLYEVMMQMSDGIGVSCVHCHNSRTFTDWRQSTPARWTGFCGIQLTRRLNTEFLLPLAASLAQIRPNPGGSVAHNVPETGQVWRGGNALVTCATCHQAQPVPLCGAGLLAEYPALRGAAQPH